jgi:hypothetical protein
MAGLLATGQQWHVVQVARSACGDPAMVAAPPPTSWRAGDDDRANPTTSTLARSPTRAAAIDGEGQTGASIAPGVVL